MAEVSYAVHPLPADVVCKQRTKPVPPEPHRLVADVDAALKSRSSTFRKLSGKRTYIITTRRITSGDELKQRNGLAGLRGRGMLLACPLLITDRCIWSDRARA